jgi:hypothetical protein
MIGKYLLIARVWVCGPGMKRIGGQQGFQFDVSLKEFSVRDSLFWAAIEPLPGLQLQAAGQGRPGKIR